MTDDLSPERIVQIGLGPVAGATLHAAVELELFSLLGQRSMMAPEICDLLGLDAGAVYEFLDALVALKLLQRDGEGREDSEYRSAPDAAYFLDKARPTYLGDLLTQADARLRPWLPDLAATLRTGTEVDAVLSPREVLQLLSSGRAGLEQFRPDR